MYQGWFAVGGAEVANNERFAANAALLGLPTVRTEVLCGNLAQLLADDPYSTSGLAGSPWADAAVPEAALFAGVFVSSITGLDAATSTREVVVVGGEGGIPGPPQSAPRTMLVTAFLAGASPAALSYGLAWLDAVLRDDCDDDCAGATMCMVGDCPDTVVDADAEWLQQVRTLHDVVCVDGPRVVQLHQLTGGCDGQRAAGATVEFTLVAASPHIYRAPAAVGEDIVFTAPADTEDCDVQWRPVGAGRGSCPPPVDACTPAAGCLVDPYAPVLPEMPRLPVARNACVTRLRSAWGAATAPPGLVPRWLDSVPVVTVTPGSVDMRRLTVRFYANPLLTEVTDPDQLSQCDALTEITVSYLPRDTTLVIDGRAQEAYVVCPGGGRQDADAVLFGPDGGPFDWPRLVCGAALTVVALVDAEHYAAAATVRVELAARQDVA